MAQAFDGIHVVDFTQVFAGPYATHQLALLGADVIKVEQPGGGDMARDLLDEPNFGGGVFAPVFNGLNTSKRSLAVDLKREEAKEIVFRLVEGADVVIQNFTPGVIERLGFGYRTVKAVKPDIVYCSISGYGLEGPRSRAGAYDGAVQAASGLMATNGHAATGPTRTMSPIVDVVTGMMACFAIASALYRRRVTGEGQFLDVAMLDSAVTMLNPVYNNHLATGAVPELLGNQSLTRQPTANVFATRDGYLQITALTDRQAAALCAELGEPDLVSDPRFATRERRIENREAMGAELTRLLAGADTETWIRRLTEAGVPVAPVASLPEVMADPQLAHRDLTMTLPAPPGLGVGEITVIKTGFQTDADGPRPASPPPAVGEHTEEILLQLGFGRAEIEAMQRTGTLLS